MVLKTMYMSADASDPCMATPSKETYRIMALLRVAVFWDLAYL